MDIKDPESTASFCCYNQDTVTEGCELASTRCNGNGTWTQCVTPYSYSNDLSYCKPN